MSYGEAMSTRHDNVPLEIQEAIRATLTVEDRALLAFFGADGFKVEMTKQEALGVLLPRLIATQHQPPAEGQNPPTIVLE